jgi:hypothetical protein
LCQSLTRPIYNLQRCNALLKGLGLMWNLREEDDAACSLSAGCRYWSCM